ncbi:MAG: SET domain-containing protein-lysine N-methyltransferase [Promethearchaeota archaeon]|nr:MAG: SET domain-containing protein-lysine N-methyltransferase [Candidatus Lokiarchaeota archaeon]
MNSLLEIKYISLKKGRGVFAKEKIIKDEVIDIAPIVLISNSDWELIEDTVLSNYSFEWDDPKCKGEFESAISLSISQFINNSYKPNVKYVYDYKNKLIEYITIRDITEGEELTVNYNGLVDDKSPMWFEVGE